MLILSIVGGALFPLALIYLPDYWYPDHIIGSIPIGIEDFLFAFTIGGIGSVLYEIIFGKRHTLCECRKKDPKGLIPIILVSIGTLLLFAFVFKLNSIY